jgi:hypothetical protein
MEENDIRKTKKYYQRNRQQRIEELAGLEMAGKACRS